MIVVAARWWWMSDSGGHTMVVMVRSAIVMPHDGSGYAGGGTGYRVEGGGNMISDRAENECEGLKVVWLWRLGEDLKCERL